MGAKKKKEEKKFKERFGKMEEIKEKHGSLPTKKEGLRNLLKGWRTLKKEAEKEDDKKLQEKAEKQIKKTKKRLEETV